MRLSGYTGSIPWWKRKSGFNRHGMNSRVGIWDAGRKSRDRFYFDRALGSYRRARLIDSTDAETWLAYADIIRLKAFRRSIGMTQRRSPGVRQGLR